MVEGYFRGKGLSVSKVVVPGSGSSSALESFVSRQFRQYFFWDLVEGKGKHILLGKVCRVQESQLGSGRQGTAALRRFRYNGDYVASLTVTGQCQILITFYLGLKSSK